MAISDESFNIVYNYILSDRRLPVVNYLCDQSMDELIGISAGLPHSPAAPLPNFTNLREFIEREYYFLISLELGDDEYTNLCSKPVTFLGGLLDATKFADGALEIFDERCAVHSNINGLITSLVCPDIWNIAYILQHECPEDMRLTHSMIRDNWSKYYMGSVDVSASCISRLRETIDDLIGHGKVDHIVTLCSILDDLIKVHSDRLFAIM
jgi:hypothetical protein